MGVGILKFMRRPSEAEFEADPLPHITISAAADLIGLVPYLLGFHPTESVVVIFLAQGRVSLTARLDLPPPGAGSQLAGELKRLVQQHHASGVVVLGYSCAPSVARPLLHAAAAGLGSAGLVDVLYVSDERWWSMTCREPCCPVEGTPYDLASHPKAAEAVFAGLSSVGVRTDLEESVSGPCSADEPRLAALSADLADELAGTQAQDRKQQMAALVGRYLDCPARLGDDDCVRLAVLCGDLEVRDVAWALMTTKRAADHVALWRQVVARASEPLAAAPLCLLGMAAWIMGNGALQNCCMERAQQIDPGYTLAKLLDDINRRAVPPSLWRELADELRREVGSWLHVPH